MNFILNDGGRTASGFRGTTGDCVVRAISIATERTYMEVYEAINKLAKTERVRKREVGRGDGKPKSSARTGVYRSTYEKYLFSLGWVWTPCMFVGQGCKVHLRKDELPAGRLVVTCSRHLVAVIDGTAHDTSNPSRDGTRCVYGYYRKERI